MNSIKIQPAQSNRLIETPEGIILSMPLADPISRTVAFLIDLLLRGLLLFAIALLLSFLERLGVGIFYVFLFILWWGYYVIAETLMDGSSPGKKFMHLRVVNDDFTSISLPTSIIRNLLRVADFFPGLYGMAIISMLFSSSNKRLGDIAAQTVVISTRPEHFRQITLQEPALLPSVPFTQEEQHNIIEFARFCEVGSPDRTKEMAQHLSNSLHENNIDKLVIQLRRYAKWFLEGNH